VSDFSALAVGLDTNVLARYYVADVTDDATQRQRQAARQLIESGSALAISKTVILELEWVLRGYYGFDRENVGRVFAHLLTFLTLDIEDRTAVERAVAMHAKGLDFADALHHASYAGCEYVASFDDRGFARRARSLNLSPPIRIPR